MRFEREKQWLVFTNDEGKQLKFNLQENVGYKMVHGKWKEIGFNTLQKFFSYHYAGNIISLMSQTEPVFAEFLKFVKKKEDLCRNMGTFLTRMSKYQKVEKWLALGFGPHYGDYSDSKGYLDELKHVEPKDFNKDMLKHFIKMYETIISRGWPGQVTRSKVKGLYYFIGSKTYYYKQPEKEGDKLEFIDLNLIKLNIIKWVCEKYGYDVAVKYLVSREFSMTKLCETIHRYNYDYKKLFVYAFLHVPTREGMPTEKIITYLDDYVRMSISLDRKYDKYPRYLATKHDVVQKMINEKAIFYSPEEIKRFKKKVGGNLIKEGKEYSFTVPSSPYHVIEEGRKLYHCAGSYVDLIGPNLQIVFMRKSNEPEITLCVENIKGKGIITQARGVYHCLPNKEQLKAIEAYAKTMGLVVKIEGDV